MPTIKNIILIERPIEAVFDVATTPKYWTIWHPQCLNVIGAIDHPIQLNEIARELVKLGKTKQWVDWICVNRQRPDTLRINGKSKGTRSYIEYTFIERDGGTEFTRFLKYRFHPLLKFAELLTLRSMRKHQKISMERMRDLLYKEISK